MTLAGFLISTFLLVSAVLSQDKSGAITGTITDPDGAVVAGVTVQGRHIPTGMVYKGESSRNGTFTMSLLDSGMYELSVPAIGFTFIPYVKKDIFVQAGQTLRADVRLEWSANLGTLGDDTFLTIRNRYAGLTGPVPRMPDGKPDFSGMWNASEDPDKEKPAVLPWAAALAKERVENEFKDGPSGFCLPGEVFPSTPFLYKFVQTPSLLLQFSEDVPAFRQVFLDKRDHPKVQDPTWKGHSIGKWEGDTLVIDTVGFNDKGWLPDALPYTELLHIVERYNRPDVAHLTIEVSIEDPGAFTKPWHLHMAWDLAPGEELIEYICTENNQYQTRPIAK